MTEVILVGGYALALLVGLVAFLQWRRMVFLHKLVRENAHRFKVVRDKAVRIEEKYRAALNEKSDLLERFTKVYRRSSD